jgi:hypothetical protein
MEILSTQDFDLTLASWLVAIFSIGRAANMLRKPLEYCLWPLSRYAVSRHWGDFSNEPAQRLTGYRECVARGRSLRDRVRIGV